MKKKTRNFGVYPQYGLFNLIHHNFSPYSDRYVIQSFSIDQILKLLLREIDIYRCVASHGISGFYIIVNCYLYQSFSRSHISHISSKVMIVSIRFPFFFTPVYYLRWKCYNLCSKFNFNTTVNEKSKTTLYTIKKYIETK